MSFFKRLFSALTPPLRTFLLIVVIMIMAFLAFSTIIERSKETSKDLTVEATGSG
ncbi:MAG: hypothetical protein PHX61_01560 [Alphaproteobacteria bacterium]|nr:hypothetical protein [Alphaproteobacteria bacterium]